MRVDCKCRVLFPVPQANQFVADKAKWSNAASHDEAFKEAKNSVDKMAMIGKAYSTQSMNLTAPIC
jgi:hypothetical protein